MGIASGFIQHKYNFTNVSAGFLLSAPQIIVLLVFPLFGKIVDKYGCLSIMCIFVGYIFLVCSAGLSLSASLTYLAFTPDCDRCYAVLPGSFMFGIGYALYVPTLWSSPAYFLFEYNKKGIG